MKKNILTNVIFFLLILQSAMISSMPLMVCFGEDGHSQIEIKKKLIHFKCTVKCIEAESNLSDQSFSNQIHKCHNCLDIQILFKTDVIPNDTISYHYVIDISPLSSNELSSYILLNRGIIKTKDIVLPDIKNNTILQKMSFLI